jgi:hypothetical protein
MTEFIGSALLMIVLFFMLWSVICWFWIGVIAFIIGVMVFIIAKCIILGILFWWLRS